MGGSQYVIREVVREKLFVKKTFSSMRGFSVVKPPPVARIKVNWTRKKTGLNEKCIEREMCVKVKMKIGIRNFSAVFPPPIASNLKGEMRESFNKGSASKSEQCNESRNGNKFA